MSSTPESSPESTPSTLSFSETAEDEGNRWSAGVVAVIVAVIVLIAAGVTAAVVLTRKPSAPELPQPAPTQIIKPAAAVFPRGAVVSQVALMSTQMPLAGESVINAAGSQVDLGNGISITPVSGWEVYKQDKGFVELNSQNYTANLAVFVGQAKTTDSAEQLTTDIDGFTDAAGFSNVKLNKKPTTTPMNGNNFQEGTARGYTAQVSTQQGTADVSGAFVELMNTSTGMSAFLVLATDSQDTLKATADDVDKMISSMV